MNLRDILKIVTLGIVATEQVSQIATDLKGQGKQDLAIAISGVILPTLAMALNKDQLNDPEIQKAIRTYIDTTVALKNIIKKKTGKDVDF